MRPRNEDLMARRAKPKPWPLAIAGLWAAGILAGLISSPGPGLAVPIGEAVRTPSLPVSAAPPRPRPIAGATDESGRDPALAERLRRLGLEVRSADKSAASGSRAEANTAFGTAVRVMVQPTVQATNTAPLFSSPIANLVNQTGLSTAYADRFTGFDSYAAAATHVQAAGPVQHYYQFTPSSGGTIDFNLGSPTVIDCVALWQVANNGGELKTITLVADDNPGFSSPTFLGTFALTFDSVEPTLAQVFTFSSTEAQYVRLTVVENFGLPGSSILGEIAFAGGLPAPASNDRFAQQVAGSLDIHWERISAPSGFSPCSGIEFTNGTFADAADGTVSMSGIGVSAGGCIGLDNYTLTMAPDGLSLSGFASAVPMTLTRGPRDACFVGDWVASGSVYRAHIAADPFPVPAFDPANLGEWAGWAQQGGIDLSVRLSITGEVWNGSSWQIAGAFDWKCLFGAECSGTEIVQGTITPAGVVQLAGTALIDGENLILGVYPGQRSANGRTISGTFAGGTWNVSRVSAYAVPSEVAAIQDAVDFFPNRPALRVEVAAGTHAENLDLAPLAASPGAVEITGMGLPAQVILDDGLPGVAPPIITTNGAASVYPVLVRNLTLTGGNVQAPVIGGAGLRVVGGSTKFVLEDCIVRNNVNSLVPSNSGGVYVSPVDRLRIDNCVITANSASQQAGGILAEGTLVLTRSTVSNNTATQGAGMVALGPATITHCEIRGHRTNSSTAGIWLESNASAVVDDCLFEDNVTEFGAGGGLYIKSTNVQVTNSTFAGNGALRGGALAVFASLIPVTVSDCTFTGNTADQIGGAIYTQGHVGLSVVRSTIQDNTAQAGGGFNGLLSTGTFTDCDFAGNVGTGDGGAAIVDRLRQTFINCRFFDNEAQGVPYPQSLPPYGGGAVLAQSASNAGSPAGIGLINCTVVNNRALGAGPLDGGGGVLLVNGYPSSPYEISNSILWGNTAPVGSLEDQQIHFSNQAGLPIATATSRNVIVKGLSPATTLGPGPLWGDDPLFVSEAAGNLRLTVNSPAIDAGNNALLPVGIATDLDGLTRFIGAGVDLGPYEFTTVTGVNGPENALPRAPQIVSAYPNPFNPATKIVFALPRTERVRLTIFDMSGRLMRVLLDEHRTAGSHEVMWNGLSDTGQPVASGVYLCSMDAGSYRGTRRMTLVK